MTLWVLHHAFSPQEEAAIEQQKTLPLATMEGVPDITAASRIVDVKHLLRLLHAGEAPETIDRKAEKLWNVRTNMQPEDVLLLPLPSSQRFALAKVLSPCRYRVSQNGADEHYVEVEIYAPLAERQLKRHKEVLQFGTEPLKMIENQEVRKDVLRLLPHKYNRFGRVRWIVGVIIGLKITAFVLHQLITQ